MKIQLITVLAATTMLLCAQAQPTQLEVTTTADDGPGSLRNALATIQAKGTITFNPSLNGQTILLTSGQLVINRDVSIRGPGAARLAIDGNAASRFIDENVVKRVFHIAPGNFVTIAGLTVTNGYVEYTDAYGRGYGGGIYNDHSVLTLTNCIVTGNRASSGGGGIASNGEDGSATLTVCNCIVTRNSARYGGGIWSFGYHNRALATVIDSTICTNTASDGGGFYNDDASDLTIIGSTICNNSTDRSGGGIVNDLAALTVMFSTLSGNSAGDTGGAIYNSAYASDGVDATAFIAGCTLSGNFAGSGGGIYNQAVLAGNSCSLSIVNCTLSGNSAGGGGGIFNEADEGNATVEIGSTILNAAVSGENLTNYNGAVTSLGYNLSTDSAGGFLNQPSDLVNTNPLLGRLNDNGGPTLTHALLCGSPAIDKGKNLVADSNTDQRGVDRSVVLTMPPYPGDGTDIGAFEAQTLPPCNTPPVANCKNVTVSADSNCSADASIDNGSFDPDAGDSITLAQSPPGPYPLGTNSVTLTVTDNHGASSSCVATITVVDDTPPTITCPPDQTANATSSSGGVVNYPTISASDACGPLTFNYSKDTDTVFPIGDTIVSVTLTDGAGNLATCSFNVHVKGAAEQITELVANLNGMTSVKAATRNALLVKLQAAMLAARSGNKPDACEQLTDFINLTKAQKGKKLVPATVADEWMADAAQIQRVLGCR